MPGVAPLATLLVAVAASAFMAWVVGAGSSGATPFAPAVGANAISVLRAGFVVGLLGLAGAVLQGESVSTAVGTGLVEGVVLAPAAVVLVLVTAAGLMAAGIATGYPIATAFTVTGAVVGTGLALGGSPAWGKYGEVAALWVVAPVLDGALAYGLASALPREDVPERRSIPALGAVVAAVLVNVRFAGLRAGSVAATVAAAAGGPPLPARVAVTLAAGGVVAAVLSWHVRRDEEAAIRHFLLVLGSLVAFSAGASQVGLAVGPLLPLLSEYPVPAALVVAGGGVGLLVGSWTGAPRMIQSLSREYAALGPRRSIAALVPSFLVAQVAVLLGVPVSFNEIVVSAIVGAGLAVGAAPAWAPASSRGRWPRGRGRSSSRSPSATGSPPRSGRDPVAVRATLRRPPARTRAGASTALPRLSGRTVEPRVVRPRASHPAPTSSPQRTPHGCRERRPRRAVVGSADRARATRPRQRAARGGLPRAVAPLTGSYRPAYARRLPVRYRYVAGDQSCAAIPKLLITPWRLGTDEQ